MWSMTPPARWSSLQMSARMARTSSRSGVALCSSSSAASALRRMAPSGWFNSWARPDASWAMVEMRPRMGQLGPQSLHFGFAFACGQ